MMVLKHWSMLPGEAVDATSLQVIKVRLSNLIWPTEGGWTRGSLKNNSNSNYLTIN